MNVDPDTTVAGQINEDRGSHQLFHIENKDKLVLHLLWIRNPTRPSSKGSKVTICNQKKIFMCFIALLSTVDMTISSSLNYIFSLQLFLFQVQENQMGIKGTSDKEEICFNFTNTKFSLDGNTLKYVTGVLQVAKPPKVMISRKYSPNS